jgi:3-oxoadipate enol-lactonase
MPYLEIAPKLKIHYADHNPNGQRNILLLHGLGATCDSWLLQAPALIEAGYHMIAPDARGFGKSSYPGGKVAISDFVSDLFALLSHLGISQTDIIGISMGGVLAQQFTLDHPERVSKLILVNTFAMLKPDNLSQFFYFLLRRILVYTVGIDKQGEAVANRIFPHPEQAELRRHLRDQISQADPGGYRATMQALAGFNSLARLREIQTPTLVVTSSEDSTVSPHRQLVLAETIPNSKQIIIPGANHAVTAEFPEQFNRIMLGFLLDSST